MSDKPDPSHGLPLLLKKEEAAHQLNVSPRHIENLVTRKLLKKVKLGGKVARITTASVLALAGQRAEVLD